LVLKEKMPSDAVRLHRASASASELSRPRELLEMLGLAVEKAPDSVQGVWPGTRAQAPSVRRRRLIHR
jgi:hypothetical protein